MTLPDYPLPWSFDFRPHPIPEYSQAHIYAADSTKVSTTHGEDAEKLAQLIIDSVNETNAIKR